MSAPEPAPPQDSILVVLLLLLKLGIRRLVNRTRARSIFGKKKQAGQREATGKRGGGAAGLIGGFFALYMCFFVVMQTTQMFSRLSTIAETSVADHIALTPRELSSLDGDAFRPRRGLHRGLAAAWATRVVEAAARGVEFEESRATGDIAFLPSVDAAPHPWAGPLLLRLVTVPLTGLFLMALFTSIGVGLGAGGKEDRSLEWLMTMPVRAGPLLTAQVLQHGMLAIAVSVVATLALCTIGWAWGHGPVGALLGLLGGALLATAVGALRVIVVLWARLRLPSSRLRNLGAAAQVVAMLSGLPALAVALVPDRVPVAFFDALQTAAWLPYLPTALPVHLFGPHGLVVAAAVVAISPALVWGAARLGQHLIRGGVDGGAGESRRGGERTAPASLGMFGRELLLLRRDRNVLVQRLVVPAVLLVWFGLTVGGDTGILGASTPVAAAGFFGALAYAMMMSNLWTLASEGSGIWLLYTLPTDPGVQLRRKALLWTGIISSIAAVLAVALLVTRSTTGVPTGAGDLSTWVFALLGIPLIGMLSAAIGVLGVDRERLKEADLHRRLQRTTPLIGMLLIGAWAGAVFAERTWPRVGLLVLYGALVIALWRRVSAQMGWLLDPTAEPEKDVDLADGLVIALVFFIGQGLVTVLLILSGIGDWAATFGGFVGGGGFAVVVALVSFRDRGIRDAGSFLRLKPPTRWPELTGALFAVVPAGLAVAWLGVLQDNETLSQLLGPSLLDLEQAKWWVAAMAVLAAPLFEEFIFRGLVHRGLRRELPVGWAIAASAAIFAVIHPAASSVPVFALGVAAAWAYERTGTLRASIAAHMAYNAFVIWYQL